MLALLLHGTAAHGQGVKDQIPAAEYSALVDLYKSTHGADWRDNGGWLNPNAVSWDGVTVTGVVLTNGTVSKRGSVTSLVLTGKGLFGSIPESIGSLSQLTVLNLSDNFYVNINEPPGAEIVAGGLTGSIPESIGSLSLLTVLDLDTNALTPGIPASIGNLSQLTVLNVSNQLLPGSLPGGSIPESIGSLSRLTVLDLNGSQLAGSIPASIGSLSQLTTLDLGGNYLTGSIPASIGSLAHLTVLNLSDKLSFGIFRNGFYISTGVSTNQLTGGIPASFGNLSQLTTLDLHTNQLTGSIPASLGNLSQLTTLDLDTNQLTGIIPASLGSLSHLTILELNTNQLTGIIPASLGSLSQLTYLDLHKNHLTGSIPASLGNLSQLGALDLDTNRLTGSVPSSLGSLSQLTLLDLHENQLSGEVPQFALSSPSSEENIEFNFAFNSIDISQGSDSQSSINALINAGANVTYAPQYYFIAAKGDLVGPNQSEKLLAAGVPAVDDAGDVAFRAILTGTGSTNNITTTGILLYSGTTVTLLASTGSPAPGANGAQFSTLGDPVLSGSGALAFVGRLKTGGGVTNANATGVWISTGGTTRLAVRTGQTAPTGSSFPTPVDFKSIKQIGIDNAAGLTLLAGLAGPGVATTGLFSTDLSGNLWLLVNTGTVGALSARGFSAFVPLSHVSGQSRSLDTVNGNVVIFGPLESASTTSIATFVPGPSGFQESIVAQTGGAVPGLSGVTFKSFDEPAINANGDVAFLATLSGSGVKAANSSGIYLVSGGTGGFVARAGDFETGAGNFRRFGDPVLNNNGGVAFLAALTVGSSVGVTVANQWGIWSTAGGTLHQITQQGDGTAFSSIVLPDFGDVSFLANTIGGYGLPQYSGPSIWATPPGFSDTDVPIAVIATAGFFDLMNTQFLHGTPRTVSAIRVFQTVPSALGQGRSFDAGTGNLVYETTFTDGEWGIYEAAVP